MKTKNDFMYKIEDNGEATIYKYMGSCEELIIPGSIDGKPVTTINGSLIGNAGLCNSDTLKRIIVPEGVKKITMKSFSYCNCLQSVKIPASVTEIDSSAFKYSRVLSRIEVDENNLDFSDIDGVLFNKDRTRLIHFPHGKSYRTGGDIPEGFIDTLSYIVPDDVISIGNRAFQDCSLESIELPDSLTELGAENYGLVKP